LYFELVGKSRKGVLLGEASWAEEVDASTLLGMLYRKAENFPHVERQEVLLGLWLKSGHTQIQGAKIITPPMVIRSLR